ncbi:hypothetical protein NPIL_108411 [Nephila pilipes]|uniref:Uncharacterized protein n=1 Tax=Nephila pilipes TaxID=299642 RepID=A0A8X6JD52_NEPPI|nr:hypothetical protein NPIL_108411 [Nephila pilipes]
MMRKSLNIKENNHQIFRAKCDCAESQGQDMKNIEYDTRAAGVRNGYKDEGEGTSLECDNSPTREATRIQNKALQFESNGRPCG